VFHFTCIIGCYNFYLEHNLRFCTHNKMLEIFMICSITVDDNQGENWQSGKSFMLNIFLAILITFIILTDVKLVNCKKRQ